MRTAPTLPDATPSPVSSPAPSLDHSVTESPPSSPPPPDAHSPVPSASSSLLPSAHSLLPLAIAALQGSLTAHTRITDDTKDTTLLALLRESRLAASICFRYTLTPPPRPRPLTKKEIDEEIAEEKYQESIENMNRFLERIEGPPNPDAWPDDDDEDTCDDYCDNEIAVSPEKTHGPQSMGQDSLRADTVTPTDTNTQRASDSPAPESPTPAFTPPAPPLTPSHTPLPPCYIPPPPIPTARYRRYTS
jgi:hypothetical protein